MDETFVVILVFFIAFAVILIVTIVLGIVLYLRWKKAFITALNGNPNDVCIEEPDHCDKRPLYTFPIPSEIKTTFDPDMALFLAELIGGMEFPKDIRNSGIPSYFRNIHFIESHPNKRKKNDYPFGYLARDSSTAFIILRGTQSMMELKRDFQYKQIVHAWRTTSVEHWCQGAKIHSGFHMIYRNVKKLLLKDSLLEKTVTDVSTIVISGHSLGGAIASLLGVWIAFQYPNKTVIVYTFGKPRVGNPQYKKCIDQQKNLFFYRLENTEDIIVGMPWPVSPALDNPEHPIVYLQEGKLGFNYVDNWGALLLNHCLKNHIQNLIKTFRS